MRTTLPTQKNGSVLILVMILTAVLLIICGSALSVLTQEYSHSMRSAVWNESLYTAEAGIDMAYNALNRQSGNSTAWSGWTPSATTDTNHSITMTIVANGNGPSAGSFAVNAYMVTNDWVIISLGTCTAPNSSISSISRQVEVRLTPSSPFSFGLLAKEDINFNGNNVLVDSYNSDDTATFPNGQYVVLDNTPTPHANLNGDVGTNGTQLNAGNSNVYGDLNVGVDGEILTGPNVYVAGSQDDGLQVDIPDATGPGLTTTSSTAWTPSGAAMNAVTGWPTTNGSQVTINNTSTLAAGDHNISSISLSGTKTLTIDATAGNVRIYVSGDVSVGGNAQVNIVQGATPHTVTIWVVGSVDVGGNGVVTPANNIPGHLKIFAKAPAEGDTQSISLHGNADFKGAIYAPGHDFTIGGGGVSGVVFGSVVGKTITLGGGAEFHYEEALGNVYNSGAAWDVVYWRETNP